MLDSPLWLTTCTQMIMTGFRLENAHVAGSKSAKTNEAITLVVGFFCRSVTCDTNDSTLIMQMKCISQKWSQRNKKISQWQIIAHWLIGLCTHFS